MENGVSSKVRVLDRHGKWKTEASFLEFMVTCRKLAANCHRGSNLYSAHTISFRTQK